MKACGDSFKKEPQKGTKGHAPETLLIAFVFSKEEFGFAIAKATKICLSRDRFGEKSPYCVYIPQRLLVSDLALLPS
jgi:hypothetical protein